MAPRFLRLLPAIPVLLAAVSSWAQEPPGVDAKWRHWQSPNFEVYSRNRDDETRELLHNLELLRAVFLDTFKLKERRPLPITAYYFGDEKFFRAYKPEGYRANENFRGFYSHQPDRASIVMGPAEMKDDSRHVIFHEYIHHLVRVTEEEPPPWYNEGIAELFATIEVHPDHLAIGRPIPGRIAQLQQERLLPLEQLFATTYGALLMGEGRHTGVFYSQSWALLHYCHFGMTKLPRDKLELFLRVARLSEMTAKPERLRSVCQELLGMDYGELSRVLESYIRNGRYQWGRLPLPKVAAPGTYAVRAVPSAEMATRLSELRLRLERSPAAKLALLLAAERDPSDTRLHEALGTAARYEGDEEGTRDRWQRAVDAGTRNPAIFHELGLMESRRWFQRFDLHFRMPDETAVRLRRLLHQSIGAAPEQSSAYEMLAWIEATARNPEIANINLVQARYPHLKDKARTLLALAMVRWRSGDNGTATQVLDVLDEMETDEWVRHGAEQVRAKVEDRAPLSSSAPGIVPGKAPPVRVPSVNARQGLNLPPPK